MRFFVHNVATGNPGQEGIILLIALVLDLHKCFFRLLVLTCGTASDAIIPVKVIIVDKVWSDRLKIDKDIIELFQNEEAACHALTTWDCIALRGARAYHLEEVLGDAHVVFLLALLTDQSVNYSLQDVLFG